MYYIKFHIKHIMLHYYQKILYYKYIIQFQMFYLLYRNSHLYKLLHYCILMIHTYNYKVCNFN